MKKLLFFVLFAISCLANAQSNKPVQQCLLTGQIYMSAAGFRDAYRSPQQSLEYINQNWKNANLNQQVVKNIINSVYFNPAFQGVSGTTLYRIYVDDCTNPKPKYQPV